VIYIITAGSYDDYRIIRAATDKKWAREFVKNNKKGFDNLKLEVYEDGLEERMPYSVVFDKDCNYSGVSMDTHNAIKPTDIHRFRNGVVIVTIAAHNYDEAVKLAREALGIK